MSWAAWIATTMLLAFLIDTIGALSGGESCIILGSSKLTSRFLVDLRWPCAADLVIIYVVVVRLRFEVSWGMVDRRYDTIGDR
jgi:hypothetical protein